MRAKTLSEHVNSKIQSNAISAKGVVISVFTGKAATDTTPPSDLDVLAYWVTNAEQRSVSVKITSTGGAVPHYYPCVGWNSVNATNLGLLLPKIGDGVLVGFMNGNPEFPYIIAHYPGKATQAATAIAETPRPSVPVAAITASHVGLTLPGIAGSVTGIAAPLPPLKLTNILGSLGGDSHKPT